jgi:hypothetical protein
MVDVWMKLPGLFTQAIGPRKDTAEPGTALAHVINLNPVPGFIPVAVRHQQRHVMAGFSK